MGTATNAFVGLLCVALVACAKSTPTPGPGARDADIGADIVDAARADVPSAWDGGPRFVGTRADTLDLLIVTEEDTMLQSPLAAGIPWILQALVEQDVDVRVGVIGSDLGDPAGVGCELPSARGGALIDCARSTRGLFFDAALVDREEITSEMRCRVPRSSSLEEGTRECHLAQSFDALLAAMLPAGSDVPLNTPVTHGDGVNAEFFRRDAYLAVLVLTAPDECSIEDPELTTSDRYRGANVIQRCVLNPEAMRATREIAAHLSLVRSPNSFGYYTVSNMPSDLSGRPVGEILEDPRMAFGEQINERIAFGYSDGWEPDARIRQDAYVANPGRRVVELGFQLDALGVHTGVFPYQGETSLSGQEAFEAAVAPLVSRVLQGLRQPR